MDATLLTEMSADPSPSTGPSSTERRSSSADAVASASVLAAFLFGGAAAGLGIALTLGGGTIGAIIVGTFALPLAFGLSASAWRTLLGAWLMAGLARSLIRSRGDETRFREETLRSLAAVRDAGPTALPGTWVFLPITLLTGLVAAVLMVVVGAGDGRFVAGALLWAAAVADGIALRRLARRGRLPIPE